MLASMIVVVLPVGFEEGFLCDITIRPVVEIFKYGHTPGKKYFNRLEICDTYICNNFAEALLTITLRRRKHNNFAEGTDQGLAAFGVRNWTTRRFDPS